MRSTSSGVIVRMMSSSSPEHALKIIDVTLTLRPDMPTWPGQPAPTLTPPSRTWLASRDIVLVGVDYLSIEPFGSSPIGHPVHKALLGKGVVIVEGVDLHDVEPGDYDIACLPLKILAGDGAPARVVLTRR